MFSPRLLFHFLALLFLTGCATPPSASVTAGIPPFEPEKFFEGRTHSSGVFENRIGQSRQEFVTDATGRREGALLKLDQKFIYNDGRTQERHWQIRRLDGHHYEGTANDVVGVARGETVGNTFRLSYTVALKPGNPLFNVRLDQVMSLQRDGTVENHATISKFGFTLSTVTEHFVELRSR